MLCVSVTQVDSKDFSEIGTISTEGRCVLDLCVDAADNYIGLVTLEPNELMSCSARVYEVGRRRMQVRPLRCSPVPAAESLIDSSSFPVCALPGQWSGPARLASGRSKHTSCLTLS